MYLTYIFHKTYLKRQLSVSLSIIFYKYLIVIKYQIRIVNLKGTMPKGGDDLSRSLQSDCLTCLTISFFLGMQREPIILQKVIENSYLRIPVRT